MIQLIISLLFITGFCNGYGQSTTYNKFICPCEKIGLNRTWADSNKVTCLLIPVNKNAKLPAKGKYYLAAAIATATNKTTQQPLLYLHGGPGIATLGELPYYLKSATWKLLRQQHDLIFFDYRGTGFSQPAICTNMDDSLSAFTKTNPSAKAKQEYEVALYRNCRENLFKAGNDLADFSTFQLGADAEAIRKALQIKQWSIYGVSYGTTVALSILRNFSSTISSVILDSPFPPNAPWNDFVRPFDTCFKVLEKNIANNNTTAKIFPGLRNDFANAVKRLNDKPAAVTTTENGKPVSYNYTGDDFAWSIWSAMLKPKSIPYVPLAIKEIGNGNDSVLQKWSTAFSSTWAYGKFSETQSRAILCFEAKPKKEEDTEVSLRKHYPDFISFNSGLPIEICNAWRPDSPDKKIFDPVVSNVPVLILCGEYDPVCPPWFGAITAATLSSATLIVVPSASHAAIHADDCLRKIANDFIAAPKNKITVECVAKRSSIKFITEGLLEALQKL